MRTSDRDLQANDLGGHTFRKAASRSNCRAEVNNAGSARLLRNAVRKFPFFKDLREERLF